MTAASQKERSAKSAAKRAAVGEIELRHRVRPGIRTKLADLMAWHGIEEQAEAIQLLILNATSVQLLPAATELDSLPLRHRARPGLIAKIKDLDDKVPAALIIESLITAAHGVGPTGSAPMLAIPRHEIRISENVARRLYRDGAAEAAKLDRAET